MHIGCSAGACLSGLFVKYMCSAAAWTLGDAAHSSTPAMPGLSLEKDNVETNVEPLEAEQAFNRRSQRYS